MRHYEYVGPAEIREAARGSQSGTRIVAAADLERWVRDNSADREPDGSIPVTFTVGVDGVLCIAPRRSEHVACAAGGPVLAAGELFVANKRVVAASNLSTGFCPEVSSWTMIATALDRAGIAHPPAFTTAIEFRRCPSCGERNVIKDDHYACAICDAELPRDWNF